MTEQLHVYAVFMMGNDGTLNGGLAASESDEEAAELGLHYALTGNGLPFAIYRIGEPVDEEHHLVHEVMRVTTPELDQQFDELLATQSNAAIQAWLTTRRDREDTE